jgi:hypothetical protein
MKRLFIALILACVTAAAAYGVFLKVRPGNQKFDCEIKWLSHKLALTPEQTDRVRAIHLKYCPSMNGLGTQLKSCSDSAKSAELKEACCNSANKLVDSVCAELTPQQREEYMKLLEARGQNQPMPNQQPPPSAK